MIRIGTDYPELSYTISFSHAFSNPKWSAFIENQGIDSDRYSDILLRDRCFTSFNPSIFRLMLALGGNFKKFYPADTLAPLGCLIDWIFTKTNPYQLNRALVRGTHRKNAMKRNKKSNQLGRSKKEIRQQQKKRNKKRKKRGRRFRILTL